MDQTMIVPGDAACSKNSTTVTTSRKGERHMKLSRLLAMVSLLALGTSLAMADPPGKKEDFAGNYFASLPERAEILQLHQDGTAGMTLSDEVTAGAGGFTFSDSYG